MQRQIAGRPVLVAASTHPGEEEMIVTARQGADARPTPSHDRRAAAPGAGRRDRESLVGAAGLALGRRSRGEDIGAATDVYLADTIGEMGLWYRLATIAFLGGSMVPRGGQNPIEPAKLGVAIVHGTHVGNFREVYEALSAAGAVVGVDGTDALAAAVKLLIEQPAERERLARAALACVARLGGALERTLDALEPYLAPLCQGHEASARA